MPDAPAPPTNERGQLDDTLKRKVGPLPVWGWGIVFAGALGGFLYLKHKNAGTVSLPAFSTVTSTSPSSNGQFGAGTVPTGGGSSGDGSTTTPPPTQTPPTPPATPPATPPTPPFPTPSSGPPPEPPPPGFNWYRWDGAKWIETNILGLNGAPIPSNWKLSQGYPTTSPSGASLVNGAPVVGANGVTTPAAPPPPQSTTVQVPAPVGLQAPTHFYNVQNGGIPQTGLIQGQPNYISIDTPLQVSRLQGWSAYLPTGIGSGYAGQNWRMLSSGNIPSGNVLLVPAGYSLNNGNSTFGGPSSGGVATIPDLAKGY